MASEAEFARGLLAMARAAKASAAQLSDMADASREIGYALAVARARHGDEAVPPSWEVEREAFMRRLLNDPPPSPAQ